MIGHFLKLEWKQYFRSSYWQKSIVLNIFLVFFALLMILNFLSLGVMSFFLIEEQLPGKDPLQVVNSYLVFAVFGDLVFRYLMQKLPVMNIKPMLTLPVRKSKLVHYVLGKSIVSFFNMMPLFFYIPFAIVLIGQDYDAGGALGWLFSMIFITLSLNFLNFIINKSQIAFGVIFIILASLVAIQTFEIFDIATYAGSVFDAIFNTPILVIIPVVLTAVLYYMNYKQLRSRVYLDDVVSVKTKEANSADLSWADRMGDVAPFIKNDIRLIWRNKRPRTVFLMSFIFVLYVTIFFGNETYETKMPAFLIFASVFATGGFALNFGQFIPAWDSSYYKMLMSQNIKYRKYLESKWVLMVVMTSFLYILCIPYLFIYGMDEFLMLTAGAAFNIGFNSLFLLYAGSFNRKRIDLEKSAFANYQGTSATQFIIILPLMGLPMLLFWGFKTFFGFNAGIIAIATVGVLALLFKNALMGIIEKKYINNKYATVSAFDQKA
jgi:hypothetical protein